MPLEMQGHTVPHWKALRYGKYQASGLSTFSIGQDILKSANLPHKLSFLDSLIHTIVGDKCDFKTLAINKS